MPKIKEQLTNQINEAMKARDSVRVSTLRMLLSELKNFSIDSPDMTEEDEISVVRKEVKKRTDAIEAFEKAGRVESALVEKEEKAILEEFLPQQMGDDELEKIVDEALADTGANNMSQMGQVIGAVMKKAQGQADGSRVAIMVKEKLA